jgi:prepilin-type processing-associated H-X9-DG protein
VVAYGGTVDPDGGHSQWIDGNIPQTGFTTVFTPNTDVFFSDSTGNYDGDFVSAVENSVPGQLVYAAITSRSYHYGYVNVLLMDGSVRQVQNSIAPSTWRALGTRAGKEIFANDF